MRLKIDLGGILLRLKIKRYEPSTNEDWDTQWCRVDFSFSAGDWLDYHKENDEVLLSCEVEALAQSIDALLNDQLNEITEIACVEPDFRFILHPTKDLRNDPKYIYVREEHEIEDVYMEWILSIWSDGLTGHYLSFLLDREDLKILLTYLEYVMKKFTLEDHEIKELVARDYLTD